MSYSIPSPSPIPHTHTHLTLPTLLLTLSLFLSIPLALSIFVFVVCIFMSMLVCVVFNCKNFLCIRFFLSHTHTFFLFFAFSCVFSLSLSPSNSIRSSSLYRLVLYQRGQHLSYTPPPVAMHLTDIHTDTRADVMHIIYADSLLAFALVYEPIHKHTHTLSLCAIRTVCLFPHPNTHAQRHIHTSRIIFVSLFFLMSSPLYLSLYLNNQKSKIRDQNIREK